MKEFFEKFPLEIITVSLVFLIAGAAFLLGAYHFTPDPIVLMIDGKSVRIPSADPWYKFMLKEIGFALIVAAILALSIDYITKRKHEEAADRLVASMNLKLFHAVLGRDIPNSLYSHIKKNFLEANFYRTQFRVFVDFGTIGDDPDNPDASVYVRLKESTYYKVKNISSFIQNYPIVLRLEANKLPKMTEVGQMKFDFFKINGAEVKFVVEADNDGHMLTAKHTLELSPNEEVTVDSANIVYARYVDELTYSMVDPTESAQITVVSHVPNLNINVSPNHPNDLVVVRRDGAIGEWRQDSAMVPGQGFSIMWTNV